MLLQRLKGWLGGAGIGSAVALVAMIAIGPRFVAWRWEPPAGSELSCAPDVRSALGMFVTMELWAAGIGAVIGVVIAVLLARRAAQNPTP